METLKKQLYWMRVKGGVHIRNGPSFDQGRAVDGQYLPTRLKRTGPGIKKQPLLEFESFYGGGMLVPQAFKDIVERLEPDLHQFFPVTIEQGGEVIGERYIFVVCNRLDTLNKDLTVPKMEPGMIYMAERHSSDNKVVFDKNATKEHHVWHDMFVTGRFISDELLEAMKKAGLNEFQAVPREEV